MWVALALVTDAQLARLLLAEVNWETVLAAVGGMVSVVVAAAAAAYGRILLIRSKTRVDETKATVDVVTATTAAQERKDRKSTADERKARKDALDEMNAVIELYRQDKESDRKLIHDFRNDVGTLSNKLYLAEKNYERCEAERHNLSERLDSMERALIEAGIRFPPEHK